MSSDLQDPGSQPGITSSIPARVPERRSWKAPIVAGVVLLIIGVMLGSFTIIGHHATFPSLPQSHGPVYYVTPQGGPPPASTPVVNPGGPMILSSPTPLFFIDGNVYRNSNVYRADTGVPVQQYLHNLGDVTIYAPKLVDGILYVAVRSPELQAKMAMYALRASDGAVLWKWDTCGESDNMSAPVIIDNAVYFICQTAASHYDLYALQARTGARLWLDTFSGEVALDLLANQQTLYVQMGNQLMAENAATGRQIWQQSFGTQYVFIDRTVVSNGIIYISQGPTFFALRASNGAHLWEYQFVGDYADLEPIVDRNSVYLFARQMSGPVTIYALDSTTGVLHWHKQLSNNNYGFPAVDQGNLYLVVNVFATPQKAYSSPLQRTLLAIRGSDGQTLWQQDIPWNKGKLNYAMIEPPTVSTGSGRVYLVDWQPSPDFAHLQVTLGAFSESNGALVWTRTIAQKW